MKYGLCLLALAAAAIAQEAPRAPTPEEGSVNAAGRFAATDSASSNSIASEQVLRERLPVQRVGENALVIGKVDVDAAARTVSFPAQVNMREGLVEYAVVHTSGKTHESVFSTEAGPDAVHLGCLLLGATNPPAAVRVEVAWEQDGKPVRHALEELLLVSKQPASNGLWRYSGSMFDSAGFVASREGSIVAVIQDAGALIENGRSDAADDEIHTPATDRLPADGAPVRIQLHIPKLTRAP